MLFFPLGWLEIKMKDLTWKYFWHILRMRFRAYSEHETCDLIELEGEEYQAWVLLLAS